MVSTSPGHDVGTVTLTGYLADKQYKRKVKNPARNPLNPIFRKASDMDMEKLDVAISR